MEKGIHLQTQLHLGPPGEVTRSHPVDDIVGQLPGVFAEANTGMTLTVTKSSQADKKGNVNVEVYIEGEQRAAANFLALASRALEKAVAVLTGELAERDKKSERKAHSASAPKISVAKIVEIENEDEDVILAPPKE
jgi:hypothetical protein